MPCGARLAFPGPGRFASKHQPHRGQQEGKDEQGSAGGSADQEDPELNERGDRKVCDLRLAVNGPGNTPPLFIDVVAFDQLAQTSAEGFSKGSRVEVRGALRYSEWESKASPKAKAQKRSKHSVIARELVAAA